MIKNNEFYFWQNEKISLRGKNTMDVKYDLLINEDIGGLSLVHEEMPLPYVIVKSEDPIASINSSVPAFVIETLKGEFIGYIHFNYINERHGTFSVGMIIYKEQRGKGYGSSAMELLLKYAFEERRLNKFSGFCLDTNTTSAAMMKKLGCKQEGIVREEIYINGQYHDRLLFGLTAKEYFEMRKTK